MEPAESLAIAVAVAGGVYLSVGALLDLVRFVTRLRLGWLPSLQRTLAGVGLVLMIARSTPAGAALPPPAMRIDSGSAPAVVSVDDAGPAAAELPEVPGETYQVQPGDSLWAIAARTLGDPTAEAVDGYWRAIYEANREMLGDDPNLIFPGQTLLLPAR